MFVNRRLQSSKRIPRDVSNSVRPAGKGLDSQTNEIACYHLGERLPTSSTSWFQRAVQTGQPTPGAAPQLTGWLSRMPLEERISQAGQSRSCRIFAITNRTLRRQYRATLRRNSGYRKPWFSTAL